MMKVIRTRQFARLAVLSTTIACFWWVNRTVDFVVRDPVQISFEDWCSTVSSELERGFPKALNIQLNIDDGANSREYHVSSKNRDAAVKVRRIIDLLRGGQVPLVFRKDVDSSNVKLLLSDSRRSFEFKFNDADVKNNVVIGTLIKLFELYDSDIMERGL